MLAEHEVIILLSPVVPRGVAMEACLSQLKKTNGNVWNKTRTRCWSRLLEVKILTVYWHFYLIIQVFYLIIWTFSQNLEPDAIFESSQSVFNTSMSSDTTLFL